MTASILDGKRLAEEFRAEVATEVADFVRSTGVTPCLAAVLVGNDPGSQVYVHNKQRACEKVGVTSRLFHLPENTAFAELQEVIERLNADRNIHGILIQLPLPKHLDSFRLIEMLNPLKDVDGFHPENVGRLSQGRARFFPCTPQGVRRLLLHYNLLPAGVRVVIVGRSDIVGKPLAMMLMQRGFGGDATVTVCHSRTRNLPEVTRAADVLVVAIGQPKFITADMVRPGAAIVDVGINRLAEGLVGDVDFESVKEVASWISPVPGGVGPLTIAMLLRNTLLAARLQHEQAAAESTAR